MSVEGIDVYEGNGSIDWHQVRAAHKGFAILKVNEGDTPDQSFTHTRLHAMRQADVIPGGYDFLRPRAGRTGGQEFDIFLNRCQSQGLYTRGSGWAVRPVLDVEASQLGRVGTLRYIASWVARCVVRLRRFPICYTGYYWRDNLSGPTGFGAQLWLAAYVSDPRPYVPRAWAGKGLLMWQYSETGHVPGVPGDCDLDRALVRDIEAFRKHACLHF